MDSLASGPSEGGDRPRVEAPPTETQGTKTCPRCGETIKAVATKCRFCGSELAAGDQPPCRQCKKKGKDVHLELVPAKSRSAAAIVVNIVGGLIALIILFAINWIVGLVLILFVEILFYALPKVDHPTRRILRCPSCGGARRLR